jgi:hypothetical protein
MKYWGFVPVQHRYNPIKQTILNNTVPTNYKYNATEHQVLDILYALQSDILNHYNLKQILLEDIYRLLKLNVEQVLKDRLGNIINSSDITAMYDIILTIVREYKMLEPIYFQRTKGVYNQANNTYILIDVLRENIIRTTTAIINLGGRNSIMTFNKGFKR